MAQVVKFEIDQLGRLANERPAVAIFDGRRRQVTGPLFLFQEHQRILSTSKVIDLCQIGELVRRNCSSKERNLY